jgi:hypothetical protein
MKFNFKIFVEIIGNTGDRKTHWNGTRL